MIATRDQAVAIDLRAPIKERGPGSSTAVFGPLVHRTGFIAAPTPIYFEAFAPPVRANLPTVVTVHGGAHSVSEYFACSMNSRNDLIPLQLPVVHRST
jgi:hypothetical protein